MFRFQSFGLSLPAKNKKNFVHKFKVSYMTINSLLFIKSTNKATYFATKSESLPEIDKDIDGIASGTHGTFRGFLFNFFFHLLEEGGRSFVDMVSSLVTNLLKLC